MPQIENKDILGCILRSTIHVIGRRTSEAYANVFISNTIKELSEKYSFLRLIEIKGTQYTEEIEIVTVNSNVNYVESSGALLGRNKVKESSEKIYFADGTGLAKTLPKCVADAKYIINMPLLKRHPIEMGVTLSGKNFFGTWIESIWDVHDYHKNAFTEGNPAPQTDLLAHEHIGGKTLLYIGDGTFVA